MSVYDPNFISVQFGSASYGYLSAKSHELPAIKARLPRPVTAREKAIYATIEHGIAHPAMWDARLAAHTTFHHRV